VQIFGVLRGGRDPVPELKRAPGAQNADRTGAEFLHGAALRLTVGEVCGRNSSARADTATSPTP